MKIFLELCDFSLLFRDNRLLIAWPKGIIFLWMHNTVNYIYMNEIMFSHTVDIFFLFFKKKKKPTFCKIEMCLTPRGISHADRSDQVFYWLWCTNSQRLLGSQGR